MIVAGTATIVDFWRALADAYRMVSADPARKPTSQILLLEDLLAA